MASLQDIDDLMSRYSTVYQACLKHTGEKFTAFFLTNPKCLTRNYTGLKRGRIVVSEECTEFFLMMSYCTWVRHHFKN